MVGDRFSVIADFSFFKRFFKLGLFLFSMGEVLIKVHESYRWVVAVCDVGVFGRKLIEGKRALDLSGNFFKGEEFNLDSAREEIMRCSAEDATFNFVGEKSVGLAKEMGLVLDEGVIEIEGVPVALVLL